MRAILVLIALAALPACATTASGPGGSLALGAYESGDEHALAAAFAAQVGGRYAKGSPVAAAVADLARNKFACAAPKANGGDPPSQVCRRQLTAGGCDHTWQVHLFGDAKGALARARGLYDKACGADDLLGK